MGNRGGSRTQEELMAEIIQRMVKLDFIHLAILSVNLSEHQFNILQGIEIQRLRSSEAKKSEDQPLPQ